MISQHTIDKIKDTVRIIDIVGESVALKARGSNYVGLCPFHSEKTPSFTVRESDNTYRCYGCGAFGNVFSFVMQTQGLSFPEAVEFLAARAGIEIIYDSVRNKQQDNSSAQKKALYRVNELAFRYFKESLLKAEPKVIEYVKSRGIDKELIDTFGIGYSPLQWTGLCGFLQARRVPDEIMISAGLARKNQRGELYDAFRGRLIFPIVVEHKRIAAFGGRIIPTLGDDEFTAQAPKYINSPESLIYQKNKVLYALPQALKAAKEQRNIILVEGYMDVVSLWKVGIRNVVAPCGTALTENQLHRISKILPKAYVVFDGDQAGRTAAARSFAIFLNSGMEAQALFLPQGEDPDSIARKYGSEKIESYFETLKAEAVSLLDCYINSLLQGYGVEKGTEIGATIKARVAEDMAKVLKDVRNSIERNELIKKTAYRLMIDAEDFKRSIKSDSFSATSSQKESLEKYVPPQPSSQDEINYAKKKISELPRVDQELLHVVMAKKEDFITKVLTNGDLCTTLDPSTRMFIEGLHEILLTDEEDLQKKEAIKDLLGSFGPSWIRHWKRSYAMLEDKSVNMERSFEECLTTMRRQRLINARQELKQQLVSCRDRAEHEQILADTLQINRQLARLQ